jgi:hypothetical protein
MKKKAIVFLVSSLLMSLSAIGHVQGEIADNLCNVESVQDSGSSETEEALNFIHQKSQDVINKEAAGTVQVTDYVDAITQSSNQLLNMYSYSNSDNLVYGTKISSDGGFIPGINEDNCKKWYSYLMNTASVALSGTKTIPLEQSIGLVALLDLGAMGGYLCPATSSLNASSNGGMGVNLMLILAGQGMLSYFNPNTPFKYVATDDKSISGGPLYIEEPKLNADSTLFMQEIKELATKIDSDKEQGKISQAKLAGYATTAVSKFFTLYLNSDNSINNSSKLKEVSREQCANNYQKITKWAAQSLFADYSTNPMTTEQLIAFMVALNVGSLGGQLCPVKQDDQWTDKIPWAANVSILTVLNAVLFNLSPIMN